MMSVTVADATLVDGRLLVVEADLLELDGLVSTVQGLLFALLLCWATEKVGIGRLSPLVLS